MDLFGDDVVRCDYNVGKLEFLKSFLDFVFGSGS